LINVASFFWPSLWLAANFVKKQLHQDKEEEEWKPAMQREKEKESEQDQSTHDACDIVGRRRASSIRIVGLFLFPFFILLLLLSGQAASNILSDVGGKGKCV